MKITELIFTDGIVRSIRSGSNGIIMDFVTYDDLDLEISFLGVVSFDIRDCFDHAIANYTLEKHRDGFSLQFMDDEDKGIFLIQFQNADYVLREQGRSPPETRNAANWIAYYCLRDNKQKEVRGPNNELIGEYVYDGEGRRVRNHRYVGGVLTEVTVFHGSSIKSTA